MHRFIEGAARLGFSPDNRQLEQFEAYYREMVDWNQRVNLTGITSYDDVQTKHFLDSLTVTLAIRQSNSARSLRVIDVGTGAGLPGIPLKIMWPNIGLTLLEATRKKTVFLDHLSSRLGLRGVEIVTGRAENAALLGQHREAYDVVLARAVAPLPVLLELTLPFCRLDGVFIAQKQIEARTEVEEAQRAATLLGGRLDEIREIDLPELVGRCLIVYRKITPTPAGYPRRPGTPAKKPL
jgi:16S rRNA (guanine527-N7)-methyltransferase